MDTTSHNFTFQSWTFGTIGSSVLYDVAIIDENNIWAVGEIMIADTSQLGYTKYNALHWDGNSWELKQLMWNNSVFSPIRGILILDENNFYFSAGSVFKWDGNSTNVQMVFSRLSLTEPNGIIEKFRGESTTNIYGVGNVGSLVHYNGQGWNRIESNTTLNINDIWGDYNEKTQEWEILAVAGNILQGTENQILKISNNSSTHINNANINWPLRSIWFQSSRNYYVAGSGIYQKHTLTDSIWLNDIYSITTYSINRIRASAINDIIATGGAGEVIHFNGYSWKSFIVSTLLTSGNYYGCSIKGNKIIAVGQNNPMAVITIGNR